MNIGQVKGDGEPSCFSHVEDTSIPALQAWCHKITVSSRERSARNFLTHIKTFAGSVGNYVQGFADVTEEDRAVLREKWESTNGGLDDVPDFGFGGGWANSDPMDTMDPFADLYTLPGKTKAPKVDAYGEPVGVAPRLMKVCGANSATRHVN